MPGPTRRQALGAAIGVAAGGALIGVTTASADTVPAGTGSEGSAAGLAGTPSSFDEVFEGRRIQGTPAEARASAHAHGHAGHGAGYRVLIDGRELPVMQHGRNGWSSTINHYERFATPLEAARTAVISLKGAVVVPFDPTA
ncbi:MULTISPECIES: apotyrosinase chaperone MelC1 [Streptomyces]|uniref:Tyrosinase co-factor protein n=1 Tax=Streptomyces griseus subsp. griseus (strain JCM 4626 / CBS 651.72 / NBRC 13350 / KCC S-0626 / ISP 5235) TaxID=455632 RepID=B1W2B1_STRGG|nr:tyrosinase cofactor [Streptomyces griseus]MBW3704927.1 tyrosinase [Streptomyces griseus]BAG19275.1 putative tyrosinase co-factor protein [Streptomyces griseus subsp. griseus NBRC 13350]SEE91861.1 Tyrosinase co-factor MelC1 [Streptomyces griseus]SQA23914.1 tyrosinase co-factor protein [Streptomyces griseus]